MAPRWVAWWLVVVGFSGLASAPALGADSGLRRICIAERQLAQHLKILSAQLEETGQADPRLWDDIRAALAQMKSWLQARQREYRGVTQTEGLKRLGEVEGRLRRIEHGVAEVERTADVKAARRLIPGLLEQLAAYGKATAALP